MGGGLAGPRGTAAAADADAAAAEGGVAGGACEDSAGWRCIRRTRRAALPRASNCIAAGGGGGCARPGGAAAANIARAGRGGGSGRRGAAAAPLAKRGGGAAAPRRAGTGPRGAAARASHASWRSALASLRACFSRQWRGRESHTSASWPCVTWLFCDVNPSPTTLKCAPCRAQFIRQRRFSATVGAPPGSPLPVAENEAPPYATKSLRSPPSVAALLTRLHQPSRKAHRALWAAKASCATRRRVANGHSTALVRPTAAMWSSRAAGLAVLREK